MTTAMSVIPAMIATQAATWLSLSECGAGATAGGGVAGDGGIDGSVVSLILRIMPQVSSGRERAAVVKWLRIPLRHDMQPSGYPVEAFKCRSPAPPVGTPG